MRDLTEFVAENHGQSLEEFLQAHPHPFLVLEAGSATAVPDTGFQTMGGEGDGQPAARGTESVKKADLQAAAAGDPTVRDRIVSVAKRSGTPFPGMITVGRSSNNDVVLKFQTVSKFHAYFTTEENGKRHTLTDAGSTNGCLLNKRPLGEGEKVELTDGDTVNFGGDLPFTFFLPESLHRYLPVLARKLAQQQQPDA
jgi:hypothetical protein